METIDLPLFPLGTVLVPSMTLPLHIFEPRYRQMIGACLETDRRFGVVLIREGSETGRTAIPFEVGTVAEIVAVSQLEDGRMNLVTEGRERFRILERFHDRSYLHGTVVFLDEPVGLIENAAPLAAEARRLAMGYLTVLLKQVEQATIELDLPREPVELSHYLAGLWQQIHPQARLEVQSLLEAPSAEERLRHEVEILRRESAILQRIVSMPVREGREYANPN